MPPPQGIQTAREGPRLTADPLPSAAVPDETAESQQSEAPPRATDRRPLLWERIKEANRRSAFNRRSRGEGL